MGVLPVDARAICRMPPRGGRPRAGDSVRLADSEIDSDGRRGFRLASYGAALHGQALSDLVLDPVLAFQPVPEADQVTGVPDQIAHIQHPVRPRPWCTRYQACWYI
jgi:hypothetical protein